MQKPIYFSKVEFREGTGFMNIDNTILLNLPARELSFQSFKWKKQMPAIQGRETDEFWGRECTYDTSYPARVISSEHTDFKPKLFKTDQYEQEVVFSYGIKLSDQQYEALLPLCNAYDFEPFRGRKMVMGEEGYVGYRDEIRLYFRAITDSHIPMLELPMEYYYDEAHIWPSEKLYRHIIKNIFDKEKKMRSWYTSYGGCSLFF